MDARQFATALKDVGISKSEFAALVAVTSRAVNLWVSGERELPGPVIAYLRLLLSLPAALRAQELARIKQEHQMKYDGMYAVQFIGRAGEGICALVLMDSYVFGYDGGVEYDGTYQPNSSDPSKMDLDLKLTVPAGVALVQGIPIQPADYWFSLKVTIPARGVVNKNIETPYGPVRCTIRYLRSLPSQLAA